MRSADRWKASKVLVVEDDAALADALVTCLREEGYHAVATNTLEGARNYVATHAPEALVLDLTLDGEFGGDLLTELANREDAPVTVVVSAFRLAQMVGARFDVPVLMKPFALQSVVDWIDSAHRTGRRPHVARPI
jgi:DNA-binding response OmpR family regulator